MASSHAPKRTKPRSRPRPLSWIGKLELASLAVVASGILVFVFLARYVGSGKVNELDSRLLLALRSVADPADPFGPRWVEELVRDFTALGGLAAISFITLAVAGGLALAGKGRTALTALAGIAGGFLLGVALKAMFQRARPDLVPHGSYVTSSSFPSAHSMQSAVTYLTLGAVLARVQSTRFLKAYVIALALILTFFVGFSRVYLGVHWPSDVLAGWSAGVVWSIVVWLITRRFQREGTIEPEPVETG